MAILSSRPDTTPGWDTGGKIYTLTLSAQELNLLRKRLFLGQFHARDQIEEGEVLLRDLGLENMEVV